MTALILSLSDDLIIEILRLLHYPCLVKISETCRTLYQVIRRSSLLQLIVNLGKDGLICMRPDLDSNDVMSALEDLRRRWDTLDWKPAITSSYTGPFSGFNVTYESGIFVSMQHHSSGTRIVWLDMADFTHRSVDLPYWDQPTCLATDPGQDLLVWTEFRGDSVNFWDSTKWETYLHFVELGTAGAHPGARLRSLKPDGPALDGRVINDMAQLDLMYIGIIDRAVVWRIHHYGPQGYYSQVMIFNWQLGVCVYDSAREFIEQQFDNFRLISDTVYIVTSKDHSDCGELRVYTFNITPSSNVQEHARLRCVLVLPHHLPNIDMEYMYIDYKHRSPGRSRHTDDTFSCESDEQLLLLRICYHQNSCKDGASAGFPPIHRFFYKLVIPTRVIHRFVREAVAMDAQL
ncbi:hypothetical protein BJ165DRAFT_1478594 [Panaeolus papilionaceus]|nr:hypothetical protein BJ165DRAFT_1478594 [Panaeolus papilionaceus]